MTVRWTQVCRAESSSAAYRRALDWFRRKPMAEAVALIEAEIQAKDKVCAAWRAQQEQKRADAAQNAYAEQAAETDVRERP